MEAIFGVTISAVFGAIFGSYATLFAYRLPKGESCFGRYFGPKSRCPKCGSTIRTRELIPLINWIFTLGKCSKCMAKIPRSHLFVELSTTILFVICYIKFSFGEQFIIYSLISVLSIILLVTDFRDKIFPYQILSVLASISFAERVLIDQTIIDAIYSSIFGVIAAIIFYQIFYKKNPRAFLSQAQSFDYIKFILIASILLNIVDFLLYFLAVILIFAIILLLDLQNKKSKFGFGYSLIIPFLWLIFS